MTEYFLVVRDVTEVRGVYGIAWDETGERTTEQFTDCAVVTIANRSYHIEHNYTKRKCQKEPKTSFWSFYQVWLLLYA